MIVYHKFMTFPNLSVWCARCSSTVPPENSFHRIANFDMKKYKMRYLVGDMHISICKDCASTRKRALDLGEVMIVVRLL